MQGASDFLLDMYKYRTALSTGFCPLYDKIYSLFKIKVSIVIDS